MGRVLTTRGILVEHFNVNRRRLAVKRTTWGGGYHGLWNLDQEERKTFPAISSTTWTTDKNSKGCAHRDMAVYTGIKM
eukprot:878873-Amphidinium_carterae.2